jgi:hypothetical protein
MLTRIFVLITNLGLVKVSSKSNLEKMTPGEEKLHRWFEELMVMAEKTSQCKEDNILLAGAFMSVARVLYFNHMNPDDAQHIMEQNTFDFIELIKPTIH